MFDHVRIRASDPAASQHLYSAALAELDIEPSRVEADLLEWDDFSIEAADAGHPPTKNLHIGFVAPSRKHVESFWRAGLSAGGTDDGEPGERPQYTPSYYGAFLRDRDGNSVEAVTHDDVRRGGHIDHLWIRVAAGLDAASSFYFRLARHLGLREGRRWSEGCQFRGAWATFSLVADGLPPTRGLHMAFPATDRQTVRDFHRAALDAGFSTTALPPSGGISPATTAHMCWTRRAPMSSRCSASAAAERLQPE